MAGAVQGQPTKRCVSLVLPQLLTHACSVIVFAAIPFFWPGGVFHTQLLTHMPATLPVHFLCASTCLQTHVLGVPVPTNSSEAQILTQRIV